MLLTLRAGSAVAVNSCKARANPKTGAIEVSAVGIVGAPRWSGSPEGIGVSFPDEATCRAGRKLQRCHLGAPGTLAEITPPVECRVCVTDGGAEPCCAFVSGCTPGIRPRDASFAAGDPRACSGAASSDPACAPVGLWQRVSGSIFSDRDDVLEAVELDAGGGGQLVVRNAASGALKCHRIAFVKGPGNELVLDAKEDVLEGGGERTTAIARFARPDANSLELTDVDGSNATFALVDAASAQFACGALRIVRQFTGLREPNFQTGLGFDGTLLWYTEQTTFDAVPVNATTGATGTPIALSVQRFIETMQGPDFWTSLGSDDLQRVTIAGTVVDDVSTFNDLGTQLFVQAAAVDGAGILLLAGNSPTLGVRLLRVDTAAEPDVLLTDRALGVSLESMTFDGTSLWAISGGNVNDQAVLRIDPATAVVLQSFAMPDPSVDWRGIAAVGGRLFLVGEPYADTGVLMEVEPE
jgi:hypothetical protein